MPGSPGGNTPKLWDAGKVSVKSADVRNSSDIWLKGHNV